MSIPRPLFWPKTPPMNQVLNISSRLPGIQYFLNLELLMIIEGDGSRRKLINRKLIPDKRLDQRNVKRIGGRKIQGK
ncbi:hypothetical protein XELAEV_18000534mg [Xenopus laevis]|nr:hypothetical protein XELAEV_18000534mg [Xenopus laevis]